MVREQITWKDSSGGKDKTFDWIDVSILRKLRRSLESRRSVPRFAWLYWTRTAQHPSSVGRYRTTCWKVVQHYQMVKCLRSPEDGADSTGNRW